MLHVFWWFAACVVLVCCLFSVNLLFVASWSAAWYLCLSSVGLLCVVCWFAVSLLLVCCLFSVGLLFPVCWFAVSSLLFCLLGCCLFSDDKQILYQRSWFCRCRLVLFAFKTGDGITRTHRGIQFHAWIYTQTIFVRFGVVYMWVTNFRLYHAVAPHVLKYRQQGPYIVRRWCACHPRSIVMSI